MKKISRVLSVLLAVAMACTTLCVTSFAATNYASVSINGGTATNYTTIAKAFDAISGLSDDDTAVITLLRNTSYTGTSSLVLKGNVTFDLAGYTLTCSKSAVAGVLALSDGAVAVVKNGTITSKSYYGVIYASAQGTLTLEDLTVSNTDSTTIGKATKRSAALLVEDAKGATVVATNCTFSNVNTYATYSAPIASGPSTGTTNYTADCNITLTNCTISGVVYSLLFTGDDNDSTTTFVTVNGTEDKSVSGALNIADSGVTLTVSDGVYDDGNVVNYVAVGYEATEIVAGTSWKVDPGIYDVSVDSAITNGTVTTDVTTAGMGETITVTATPDTGYEVETVTVAGESGDVTVTDNGDGTYTFEMPDEDVTVTVTFVLTDYDVTLSEVENGTVTSETTTANMGDTVEVTITPDAGYRVGTVIITDSDNGTIEYTSSDDTYSFTMPASEVTVAVTFVKDDLSLAIGTTTGGTIEASDGSETAQLGDTVTITVTPDTGYETSGVTITYVDESGNTVEVAVTDNGDGTYSFEMPAYPISIVASFTKIDYSVSDEETIYVDHGYYTVSPTTATYGDVVTISTYPDNVYKVGAITVVDENGNVIAVTSNGDGTYNFEMPAGNVTITVTYVQFASEISGVIYVNEQYHGYFINGHLACVEHTADANGYCTVCKAYVGVESEEETEDTEEIEDEDIVEESIEIEEPVEDTDTDTEDEEPEEMEVSEETTTASNPTTGLSLALIPMAIALAGAAFGKRK